MSIRVGTTLNEQQLQPRLALALTMAVNGWRSASIKCNNVVWPSLADHYRATLLCEGIVNSPVSMSLVASIARYNLTSSK